MKRSTTVTLVLLGAAGLTAYALSRSGDDTEVQAFKSADECKTAGLDSAACDAGYDDALKAYQTEAPRFEQQSDCEKDYGAGKCQPIQARSSTTGNMTSYFVPALLGFAVAKAITNQTSRPAAQPLYNCPPDRFAAGAQVAGGSCYNTSSGRSFFTGGRGSSGSSWFSSGSSSSGSSSSTSNFAQSRTASVPGDTFSRSSSGPTVISRGGSVSRGGFGSSGHSFSSSSSS